MLTWSVFIFNRILNVIQKIIGMCWNKQKH